MKVKEFIKLTFGVDTGDVVQSKSEIEISSSFKITKTITGTVTAMNNLGDINVRIDKHIPELNNRKDNWDNCISYYHHDPKSIEAFKNEWELIPLGKK